VAIKEQDFGKCVAKVLSVKRRIILAKGRKKMSSLQKTIEKIKNLEAEKKSLLFEIEGLKKMADAKAIALENEISALREEVKSLKVLMGPEQPNAKST
jgi:hypothetical protein